jgi:hypothetical protein
LGKYPFIFGIGLIFYFGDWFGMNQLFPFASYRRFYLCMLLLVAGFIFLSAQSVEPKFHWVADLLILKKLPGFLKPFYCLILAVYIHERFTNKIFF